MKILVLGTGLQGKAALHDLVQSPDVTEIVAADLDTTGLDAYVDTLQTDKVQVVSLDATGSAQLAPWMRAAQAAIVLLPPEITAQTAAVAVANHCHWLDASYAQPEYEALSSEAQARELALLPEFGLDPGIDLVLATAAIGELDEVHQFDSYGAGIPEWEAADNPLRYKISWSFAGVLRSYGRPARLIKEGREVEIPASEIFAPQNVHSVDVEGVGRLEAYPNGNAARYVAQLGLSDQVLQSGRYTLRWPGHAAFWKKLSALGFLGETAIRVGEAAVTPQQFLHDLLQPQLQYRKDERDIALVRVDAQGYKDGKRKRVIYQVIDRRDAETGLLAMQRTVGYTISTGAQMILRGDIQKRGLLSPLTDVPLDLFFSELQKRGIKVERQELAH